MNIALGAVLIFILLIPPIAFYISYTFGRHSRGGIKFSFLDGLLASAIFSLFIHGLAILIIRKEIRFDILLKLAGGELKDLESKISNEEFTQSMQQFAWYNFAILAIMIVLGQAFRWVSKQREWHSNVELLRIHNKWWYLFEGYTLTERGFLPREYDYLFVDAVEDTHDGTMIYTGILEGYECNGEDLERIYIRNAMRRELKKKDGQDLVNTPGEAIRIPGDSLTIAYSQIKNLNLRFISLPTEIMDIEQFIKIPEEELVQIDIEDSDEKENETALPN